MLIELSVKNIALIENLQLEFSQGMNVLTGETGSGKSILVDCLGLVLGGRADRSLVRVGSDRGMVQALFDVRDCPKARAFAESLGADCADGLMIISREINANGRNICRVCGVMIPLATLKQLAQMLMDIHGQHDHQELLNPQTHISFLDSFGDGAHNALKSDVSAMVSQRAKLVASIKKRISDNASRERLTDMLNLQIREITAAKLRAGEEEKIIAKMRILENGEKIRGAIATAYRQTYSGTGSNEGAQEKLLSACRAMQGIGEISPNYAELAARLKDAYDTVLDIGYELGDLLERTQSDPEMLAKLEKRLELIDRLERKYGATVEDVIAFGEKAKAELDGIKSGDENIAQSKQELKRLDAELRAACEELRAKRHELAQGLEKRIMEQLADLGMSKTRFEIRFTPLEKPASTGLDGVEFLISPNPGQPLKGLAAIASGGELSRIMLAIKTISMDVDGISSMVFDEIDTGVSGRMAQVVGEKMCSIAGNHQVICVTHLPQIAALADANYIVEKDSASGQTHTHVRLLDAQGRIRELSRMVGSGEDSPSSLSHAQTMLERATEKRAELRSALRKADIQLD